MRVALDSQGRFRQSAECVPRLLPIGSPTDKDVMPVYMISFQCNIQNATSIKAVARGKVARRCGADPSLNRPANPSNCTVGPRVPSYWYQAEGNNVRTSVQLDLPFGALTHISFQMFEDAMHPPVYTELYGWTDGAQNDIFRLVLPLAL